MRTLGVLFITSFVLGACSNFDSNGTVLAPHLEVSFDCAPEGNGGAGAHRLAKLGPARNLQGLILTPDQGPRQLLKAVKGSSDSLYASALYAWRGNSQAGVLTDIEEVQSYQCRRLGVGQPAAFPLNSGTRL